MMLTAAQKALEKAMSTISEDHWAAGWLGGLEYTLWEGMHQSDSFLEDDEIEMLKILSEKCNGWIVWGDDDEERHFVPMNEWMEMYEKYQQTKREFL